MERLCRRDRRVYRSRPCRTSCRAGAIGSDPAPRDARLDRTGRHPNPGAGTRDRCGVARESAGRRRFNSLLRPQLCGGVRRCGVLCALGMLGLSCAARCGRHWRWVDRNTCAQLRHPALFARPASPCARKLARLRVKHGVTNRSDSVTPCLTRGLADFAADVLFASMIKGGWAYIMANRYRGGMYGGVIADLTRRVYQHRRCRRVAACRGLRQDRDRPC